MTERTYTREDMARAWEEAHREGYEDAQDYRSSRGMAGCGPDSHDCDCPNPYREQEEA